MTKILTYLTVIILIIAGMIVPADIPVAAERTGSILFDFEGIEGAEFRIYKVGSYDDQYNFTPSEAFADYEVDYETETFGETLKYYVNRDDVTPLETAETGADGTIKFKNLEKGYYLILSDTIRKDGKKYVTLPVTVNIPGKDTEDGPAAWDRHVYAKYSVVDEDQDTVDIKAQKIWDDGEGTSRPTSIVVQLTRDGEVYNEAELNKENNWYAEWKDLDADYDWGVTEKGVPDDYKVSISAEDDGKTFVITNKYKKPGDDDDNPPPPDHHKNPKDKDRLPQTGQLWWPVCLLISLGMLSIIVGMKLGNGKED